MVVYLYVFTPNSRHAADGFDISGYTSHTLPHHRNFVADVPEGRQDQSDLSYIYAVI